MDIAKVHRVPILLRKQGLNKIKNVNVLTFLKIHLIDGLG